MILSINNFKINLLSFYFEIATSADQLTSTGSSYGDIRFRKVKTDYKDFDTPPIYTLRESEYKGKRFSRSFISIGKKDLRNLAILILVAFIVRLYRINQPTSVV